MDFFPRGTETLGAEPTRFRPEVEIDGQLSRAYRCRRSDPTRLSEILRVTRAWRAS